MEVKDYCRAIETELAGWKAKIYDLSRKIEKLPTGDKEKVSPMLKISISSSKNLLLE